MNRMPSSTPEVMTLRGQELPSVPELDRMDVTTFLQVLEEVLEKPRAQFLNNRLIQHVKDGTFTRALYVQQLQETFHFVRHTPSYIMTAASRLGERNASLQKRFLRHAQEELGHDQWALQDLAALGVNAESVRYSTPLPHTSALIAYQFYSVEHVNPVGLLGLEYAMEGSTAESAGPLIQRIQALLQIPDEALTFFRRHVQVDAHHAKENVITLAELVTRGEDRAAVLRNARDSYILYAALYDGICSAVSQ